MASDKNELTITGNLVRAPEARYTGGRKTICKFSIASNRFYKKDDGFEKETSFFDVQYWGNTADYVSGNCHKGNAVEVKGRIKQDCWTSKDGKKQSKVIIIANEVTKKEWQGRQGTQSQQQDDCPF